MSCSGLLAAAGEERLVLELERRVREPQVCSAHLMKAQHPHIGDGVFPPSNPRSLSLSPSLSPSLLSLSSLLSLLSPSLLSPSRLLLRRPRGELSHRRANIYIKHRSTSALPTPLVHLRNHSWNNTPSPQSAHFEYIST